MLPKKGILIPLITLFLSLLNLYKNWYNRGTYSFLVSILGLIVVALYIFSISYNRMAFYLWYLAQPIIVGQPMPQSGALISIVLYLSQGIKLAFFIPVTVGCKQYEAGLNFLALFLIMLNRLLPHSTLTGLELSFSAYRHDNSLGVIFPVKGKVIKTVSLSGEGDWLLVKLNTAFKHQAMYIQHVLVKRNDKKSIIPGKSNQLVFFKMVPDINLIKDGPNDISDFLLEVWALCK